MTAKQAALRDIKEDLKKESKSFIAFRTELNPTMKQLETEYIKQQENHSYCLSRFTLKL